MMRIYHEVKYDQLNHLHMEYKIKKVLAKTQHYMPDTTESTLHTLTHFILTTTSSLARPYLPFESNSGYLPLFAVS